MASTTGIEVGPDSCVLAGVRTTRAGGAEVIALHTIEPATWPAHDLALAETLRSIRRAKRFPRQARVVAWGLPEDATSNATSRAAIRPLLDAGFRVDRVVTPAQALAILASTRTRAGAQNSAVVWLALNRHGVAIAIVRGGELLFARTFQWTYNPHLLEGKAQLLQRYSLISHLAPEVRRGIAAVRASHGIPVDAVVTCGDLPELRSLTMPLIEELDLEVETLDSMDGLRPVGKARFERLAESAPAIRLACAVALARTPRPRTVVPAAARIAAAVALVAGLGYGVYTYLNRGTGSAPAARSTQGTPRPATKPAANMPPPVIARKPAPTAPPAQVNAPKNEVAPQAAPQGTAGQPVKPPMQPAPRPGNAAAPQSTAKVEPRPAAPPPTRRVVASLPTVQKPDTKPAPPPVIVPSQRVAGPPSTLEPRAAPPAQPPTDFVPAPPQSRPSADTRGVVFAPATQAQAQPRPVPLKDPLPKVDSILIDQERRLAIIDGAVVAVGDPVGSRVIAQIERDAVVLREPSGLLVRVVLRARQESRLPKTPKISATYIFDLAGWRC